MARPLPRLRPKKDWPRIKCIRFFRTGQDTGVINGLSGGISLSYSPFAVDYAFNSFGDLGVVHRIGLRFKLASTPSYSAPKTIKKKEAAPKEVQSTTTQAEQ